MASLESSEGLDRFVERQVLFLIRTKGSSASIVNAPGFNYS